MVVNHNSLEEEKYYELSYYTLAHADPSFIHQHIVDAFAAQAASQNTKPITVAFALIGLYLYLEKNYTGKQVQLAHMALASGKKEWPKFALPESRGQITVADVLNAPAGQKRDAMIREWCASVWQAYSDSHAKVRDLVADSLGHSWTARM
jgi:Family of unknown function (DUF5946)